MKALAQLQQSLSTPPGVSLTRPKCGSVASLAPGFWIQYCHLHVCSTDEPQPLQGQGQPLSRHEGPQEDSLMVHVDEIEVSF